MLLEDFLSLYGIETCTDGKSAFFVGEFGPSIFDLPVKDVTPEAILEAIHWIIGRAVLYERRCAINRNTVRFYMQDNGITDSSQAAFELGSMRGWAVKLQDYFGRDIYQDMLTVEME